MSSFLTTPAGELSPPQPVSRQAPTSKIHRSTKAIFLIFDIPFMGSIFIQFTKGNLPCQPQNPPGIPIPFSLIMKCLFFIKESDISYWRFPEIVI
jgi:hypothetical protein